MTAGREEPPQPALVTSAPVFASSEKLKIAYVDAGNGDPIVFLHGVGATKRCWAQQMTGLASKFRCIALDYRGYGDSGVPPIESFSREACARDVGAVMDAAGIDKAVLCGNSLGGVVALEFYKQFPHRVESLVLVDSFAFYPGGAESIPDRIKTLDDLGIEKFAETRSPALFAPHSREVALGLDYWVTPSIVWQNEFDIELPRAGGVFVSSTGAQTPAGSIPNDHAFLSQFTIGF